MAGCRSCRTTWKGTEVTVSPPRADHTVHRPAASRRISDSRAVLPMPASPLHTRTPPVGTSAQSASTAPAAAASSVSRSSSGTVTGCSGPDTIIPPQTMADLERSPATRWVESFRALWSGTSERALPAGSPPGRPGLRIRGLRSTRVHPAPYTTGARTARQPPEAAAPYRRRSAVTGFPAPAPPAPPVRRRGPSAALRRPRIRSARRRRRRATPAGGPPPGRCRGSPARARGRGPRPVP